MQPATPLYYNPTPRCYPRLGAVNPYSITERTPADTYYSSNGAFAHSYAQFGMSNALDYYRGPCNVAYWQTAAPTPAQFPHGYPAAMNSQAYWNLNRACQVGCVAPLAPNAGWCGL